MALFSSSVAWAQQPPAPAPAPPAAPAAAPAPAAPAPAAASAPGASAPTADDGRKKWSGLGLGFAFADVVALENSRTADASRFGLLLQYSSSRPIGGDFDFGARFAWGLTAWSRTGYWAQAGINVGEWTTKAYKDVYNWTKKRGADGTLNPDTHGLRWVGGSMAMCFLWMGYVASGLAFLIVPFAPTTFLELDLTGNYRPSAKDVDPYLKLGVGFFAFFSPVEASLVGAVGPTLGTGIRVGEIDLGVNGTWVAARRARRTPRGRHPYFHGRARRQSREVASRRVMRADFALRVRAGACRSLFVLASVTALGCGPGAQKGTNSAPLAAGAERYDVLVVGAGMAGLAAAKRLTSSHRSVLVLEASDHIGGRAVADTTTFSVPIDYGASWIHGVEANPLTAVVDGLGFHRVDTELEGPLFVGDHRATPDEEKACATTAERLEEALAAAAEAGRDVSVSELLPPEWPCSDVVGDNVGRYESAAELEETSAVDAALFDSENDGFVREGLGTFVAAYGKDVPVRLRSPVTRIRYDAEGVVLELASGERHFGKRALVTVSTGVLRSGKIAFEPPLPRWKLDAIAGLPMGLMEKVVLEFRRDIFPATPSSSWVTWDGPGHDNAAFVIKPLGAPIAIAFSGGDQAKELEKDDGAAIAHAKLALRAMYGASVDSELLRTEVTHWGKSPWTLGAYSSALPGASKMHAVLSLPVFDRVFFAGEACAPPELSGSLGGAYQSALSASAALDRSLSKGN